MVDAGDLPMVQETEILGINHEDEVAFVATLLSEAAILEPMVAKSETGGGSEFHSDLVGFAKQIRAYDAENQRMGRNNSTLETYAGHYTPEDIVLLEALASRFVVGLMLVEGRTDPRILEPEYAKEKQRAEALTRTYVARMLGADTNVVGVERLTRNAGYDINKLNRFNLAIAEGVKRAGQIQTGRDKSFDATVRKIENEERLKDKAWRQGEEYFPPASKPIDLKGVDRGSASLAVPFQPEKPQRTNFKAIDAIARRFAFHLPK